MKRPHARGVTLIELIVVMSILAMLLVMGAPSFSAWILNSRIRTTAESVLAGLNMAKSEAVARNARVRFQLTSTLDNSCVLAANGANWIINLDPGADATAVEGQCGNNPDANAAPFILQARPAAAGSGETVVAAGAASVVFNGLGRLVPVPAGDVTVDITNPAGGACAPAGDVSCLRIVISAAGQIRMCNPARLGAGDPQAC